MPVVFEQPDPMGYSPAAGAAGAVAQENANREFGLRQQALAQQGREQDQALRARAAEHQASLAAHGAQMQAQAQVSPAQEFAARQQQQLLAQQQASHADLSHSEVMRIAQLKSGHSAVESNPYLTAEEKADLHTQIDTNLSPLLQRQAATRERLQQEQIQQAHQQSALQATHLKSVGDWYAQNPSGIKMLGDGGDMGALYFDGTSIKHIAPRKEAADRTDELQLKQEQHYADLDIKADKAYMDQRHQIAKAMTRKGDMGETPPPAEEVDAEMKRHGLGATLDENRGMRSWRNRPGQPPGAPDQAKARQALDAYKKQLPPPDASGRVSLTDEQKATLRQLYSAAGQAPGQAADAPSDETLSKAEEENGVKTVHFRGADGEVHSIKGKEGRDFTVDSQGRVHVRVPAPSAASQAAWPNWLQALTGNR